MRHRTSIYWKMINESRILYDWSSWLLLLAWSLARSDICNKYEMCRVRRGFSCITWISCVSVMHLQSLKKQLNMVFYAHIYSFRLELLLNGIPPIEFNLLYALIFNGNFVLVTSPLDSIYSSHGMNVLTQICSIYLYIHRNRCAWNRLYLQYCTHTHTQSHSHFGVLIIKQLNGNIAPVAQVQ